MSRATRKIVHIDEEKCDGCGTCVPSCAEGAIQVIDGKARLIADNLCDGIGDCLGDCPRGAITIETREAEAFDEDAVREHLTDISPPKQCEGTSEHHAQGEAPCGCPGEMARILHPDFPNASTVEPVEAPTTAGGEHGPARSMLGHWPVQLHLLPIRGEMWEAKDVLFAADCVGFAMPDFHERLLAGHSLVIACPKLDEASVYAKKLAAIFAANGIRSVTVAHMEVPCCNGLVLLVKQALKAAGKSDMKFRDLMIGVDGRIRQEIRTGMQ